MTTPAAQAKRVKFFQRVAIFCVASVTALGFVSAYLFKEVGDANRERAEAIRAGQVQNCLLLGDPLREAVVTTLRNQISDTEASIRDTLALDAPQFFPGVPPAKIDELIERGVARDRATVQANRLVMRGLENVQPCADRYPPLPNG